MRYFPTAITILSLLLAKPVLAANTAQGTSQPVSPEEKAKIESVVHDYLIKNPEVIVEAIQNLQKKQFEEAEKTVRQTQQIASQFIPALFHQANDPTDGNVNGSITVVEFFDYQCPHCAEMTPVIAAITKANPNVRVVFKEFPIRGPVSEFAAKAALAANKQGKYTVFSHALLSAKPPLSQETILQIAKSSGLDVEKLKKDMNDPSVTDQLKNNMKLAQDLKLFGTPAIFVGKTNATPKDSISYGPGRLDQKQLQESIDKAAH